MLLPALAWAVLIIYLSTGSAVALPRVTSLLEPDKIAHAAAYFVQASLLAFGLSRAGYPGRVALWGAVIGSAALGILLEAVQWGFYPNRFFEFPDIIANIIGALGSTLLSNYLIK